MKGIARNCIPNNGEKSEEIVICPFRSPLFLQSSNPAFSTRWAVDDLPFSRHRSTDRGFTRYKDTVDGITGVAIYVVISIKVIPGEAGFRTDCFKI